MGDVFKQTARKEGETTEEFVTDLRLKNRYCSYGRANIVTDNRPDWDWELGQKTQGLLEEPELTLDKPLESAM